MSIALPDDNPKTKFGAMKPDISLIPPAALVFMALAFMDGEKKYEAFNWRQKRVSSRVYIAACMRHLLSYLDGEDVDPKSGVPHLGHALACLGILVDAQAVGNLNDNRPIPGKCAELIAEWTKTLSPAEALQVMGLAPSIPAPPKGARRRRKAA